MPHFLSGESDAKKPVQEDPFTVAGSSAEASNGFPKTDNVSALGTVPSLASGVILSSSGTQSAASVLSHWAEPITPNTLGKPASQTTLPAEAKAGPTTASDPSGPGTLSRLGAEVPTTTPGGDPVSLQALLDASENVQATPVNYQNQPNTECDDKSTPAEDDKFFVDVMLTAAKVAIKVIILRNPYANAALKILKVATERGQIGVAKEVEEAGRKLGLAYAEIERLYQPYDIRYHRNINLMEYSYIRSEKKKSSDIDGGSTGGGGARGSWAETPKKGQDPYADPVFRAREQVLQERIAQLEQEFLQKVNKWHLFENALNGVNEFSYESIMEDIVEQILEAWKKLEHKKKRDVICKYKADPSQYLRLMSDYAERRMNYKYKGFQEFGAPR